VIAFDFVAIDHQTDVLIVVQPVTELEQQIGAGRIHHVALGIIDAYQIAVGIVEHALGLPAGGGEVIEIALGAFHPVIELVAQAFGLVVGGCGEADARVLTQRAAFRTPGDIVDDAAGGAQAVLSAGAVDHLDALDHRQVDHITVALAVAKRRGLWHAVDEDQCRAAAKGLAGAAHLLPAWRVGGDQVAQDRAMVRGDRQLLSRLITVIFCGVLPASLLARVALIVTASSSVASSAAVAGRGERARAAREIDKHRLVLRNT